MSHVGFMLQLLSCKSFSKANFTVKYDKVFVVVFTFNISTFMDSYIL